jgi:hypothetical protein
VFQVAGHFSGWAPILVARGLYLAGRFAQLSMHFTD